MNNVEIIKLSDLISIGIKPFLILIFILISFWIVAQFLILIIESNKRYINTEFTSAQLKSISNKYLRFNLIKKLNFMKKAITFLVIIFVLGIMTIGTILFIDSRDFFKQVFKTQKEKLELRTVASVDSLKSIIETKQYKIDSLNIEILNLNLKVDNTIKTFNLNIQNLNNVIKHQNEIINNLKTNPALITRSN
jgi:hypothetical protein